MQKMGFRKRMEYWWRMNEDNSAPVSRFALQIFRRLYITVDQFMSSNLGSYASALTYNTTLAAVPVLAIIFAMARGFGFDKFVENIIREALANFSPELTDAVLSFVENYLQHTRSGIFLGIGLLFLFYTLINLTLNIETAFNTIWQVTNSRNIYRRITDYLSVFLMLPLLFVIASGISVFLLNLSHSLGSSLILSTSVKFMIIISPFIIASLVFTLLYKLMPNTHVNWTACIGPGIIAGVLFQGLEYFYIHYQIKLSAYNAIYGSFAAIPLLLIFLQFTWYICLIGCQLSYANQTVSEYAFERSTRGMSRRFRDSLSLLLVNCVARRFAEGKSPMSHHALTRATRLPGALVKQLLDELVSVGILAITQNESGTVNLYLPAIDIHRLTVKTVITRLDRHGSELASDNWIIRNPEWSRLRNLRYDISDGLVVDIDSQECPNRYNT